MVEELLTHDEIQAILIEAQNPDYSNPYLLHLGSKKTSIQGVSAETGLILVHGNEFTGCKHIAERHCLTSRKPYWNEKGSLGNPTKFRLGLSNREYLKLASKIYKPENKNEHKNNRPADFDLYIGICEDNSGQSFEYRLLTYKSTLIIHSFFLSDNIKPFNKEKVLNLRQGWSKASHDLMKCIQTVETCTLVLPSACVLG